MFKVTLIAAMLAVPVGFYIQSQDGEPRTTTVKQNAMGATINKYGFLTDGGAR